MFNVVQHTVNIHENRKHVVRNILSFFKLCCVRFLLFNRLPKGIVSLLFVKDILLYFNKITS